MNRQEFIQATKRYQYGIVWPGMIVLGVMVLVPIAWYLIQDRHHELPVAFRIAGGIVCVAVELFGLWHIFQRGGRLYRKLQYWCPQCRHGFGGFEEQVLKTHQCQYCGFQVIENAGPLHPPDQWSGKM